MRAMGAMRGGVVVAVGVAGTRPNSAGRSTSVVSGGMAAIAMPLARASRRQPASSGPRSLGQWQRRGQRRLSGRRLRGPLRRP